MHVISTIAVFLLLWKFAPFIKSSAVPTVFIVLVLSAFIIGLFWGILYPVWILARKSRAHCHYSMSPDLVKSGEIFKPGRRQITVKLGIDWAWPNYFPFQYRRDMKLVFSSFVAAWLSRLFRIGRWLKRFLKIFFGVDIIIVAIFMSGWGVTTPVLSNVVIPVLIFTLANWSGFVFFSVVSFVLSHLVIIGQSVYCRIIKTWEWYVLKTRHADLKCVKCYYETTTPGFLCANPSCNMIHWDINPGKCGIRKRICGCGAILPLTVIKAAKSLVSVCPQCKAVQPRGSGVHPVINLSVFGAVASGKTQFLSSILHEIVEMATENNEELNAKTDSAIAFLDIVKQDCAHKRHVSKTPVVECPEGLPYVWERKGKLLEYRILDASGELFRNSEDSRSLAYLDFSDTIIFIFDPLILPDIVVKSNNISSVHRDATIDSNEVSYSAVVERMRNDGIDLSKKFLAFVVTKADVVNSSQPKYKLPCESEDIKDWLKFYEADNLIRRVSHDFSHIKYFAVNSYQCSKGDQQYSVIQVLNWISHNSGLSL